MRTWREEKFTQVYKPNRFSNGRRWGDATTLDGTNPLLRQAPFRFMASQETIVIEESSGTGHCRLWTTTVGPLTGCRYPPGSISPALVGLE